jgi:hypothetical protein
MYLTLAETTMWGFACMAQGRRHTSHARTLEKYAFPMTSPTLPSAQPQTHTAAAQVRIQTLQAELEKMKRLVYRMRRLHITFPPFFPQRDISSRLLPTFRGTTGKFLRGSVENEEMKRAHIMEETAQHKSKLDETAETAHNAAAHTQIEEAVLSLSDLKWHAQARLCIKGAMVDAALRNQASTRRTDVYFWPGHPTWDAFEEAEKDDERNRLQLIPVSFEREQQPKSGSNLGITEDPQDNISSFDISKHSFFVAPKKKLTFQGSSLSSFIDFIELHLSRKFWKQENTPHQASFVAIKQEYIPQEERVTAAVFPLGPPNLVLTMEAAPFPMCSSRLRRVK